MARRFFYVCAGLALLALSYSTLSTAHPGGLDSQGGHHDRKRGGYHYLRGPNANPDRPKSDLRSDLAPSPSSTTKVDRLVTVLNRKGVLSDADLLQLRDDLADRVGRFRSKGVIIDVTVLDVIDSFATRTLRAIAHMLNLRGAKTVIVGIQPDVAFAMVQLGLTLEGVGTSLDLEEGLSYLNALFKRNRNHA